MQPAEWTLVDSRFSPIYTWIRAWIEIDRGHDKCAFLLALCWIWSLYSSKGMGENISAWRLKLTIQKIVSQEEEKVTVLLW